MLFPMMLDTGADGSSVSLDVISALGLIQVGKGATYTSGGKQALMRTFTIDLTIAAGEQTWSATGLLVIEFHYVKPSIRGLIGRDILGRGDFSMYRDHTFRLEF